ncbi:MAG: TonB-dependent receptor [Bacteroidales bacterium]|nr:TonB-dependent receptor [Bacteroidales bacterium]
MVGRLLDGEKGTPMEMVPVTVVDSLGAVVAKTLTKEGGGVRFQLPDGHYKILITEIRHKDIIREITVSGANLDLGDLIMELGKEIDAATVTAEPLLRREAGRIIYDVSRDPDREKIDMMKMMKRIPDLGMSSRDGRLAYRDQTVARILVDQAENGLVNGRRQYPMNFIKAKYMSEIELVLPGSPEYNNDTPILLIKLAEPLPYGFAAQLVAKGDTRNRYSPSSDMVVNTPLVGVGIGYDFDYSAPRTLTDRTETEMTAPVGEVALMSSSHSSGSRAFTHEIHTDFFNSSSTRIKKVRFLASLNALYSESNNTSEAQSASYSFGDALLQQSVSRTLGHNVKPFRINGGIRLDGNIGKNKGWTPQGKKWTFRYSYSDNLDNGTVSREGGLSASTREMMLLSEREHRADFQMQFPGLTILSIPSGIVFMSGYYNRAYGNMQTLETADASGEWQREEDRDNGLDYRQQVAFAEGTAMIKTAKTRIQGLLSLRGEYVGTRGQFLQGRERSPLDKDDWNLIPSVHLSKMIKRSSFGIGYRCLVRRPGIQQLNPYVDLSDPANIRQGNPALKGERNHNVSLDFVAHPMAEWISEQRMSLHYSYTGNKIERITTAGNDGVSMATYANLGQYVSYGVKGNTSLKFCKKLSAYLYYGLDRLEGLLPSGRVTKWWKPSLSVNGKVNVKGFDLGSRFYLMPTLSSAQTQAIILEPRWEASVSRYFEKPHLGISVNATDLLHGGGTLNSVIAYDNFIQRRYQERLGRTFQFRIYWQFGHFRQTQSVKVDAYDR